MVNSENNKKIAKNTLMLYFRMFFVMGISLYTSRIVLSSLGVVDFGIYNVVGGVVIMLSFLNTSMTSATQRFISFELGRGNSTELKRVFRMSVNTHFIIAIFIFILAETIGLWFLNTRMVIPVERMEAANWVFQFSIFSFMTTVIGIPYIAMITAHERMNVYAYVSIIEYTLKLIAALSLSWLAFDKLTIYAILFFCSSLIILTIYRFYCKLSFPEISYKFFWDNSLYKKLMNYTGWNIFGNLSLTTLGQGVNILLNLFIGPVANAAWAISFQLGNAVSSFSNSLRMAVNPQIVKSHAIGDDKNMKMLVFESARYSFYLLLLLVLPLLLETTTILRIWLNEVPDLTVIFCQLILINSLFQSFDTSFGMIFQAIGKVKENQLLSGGTYLLALPTSYLLLELGYQPQAVFYVQIVATILTAFFVKIYLLRKLAEIGISEYLHRLAFPVLRVTMAAIIVPILFKTYMSEGGIRFMVVVVISFISIFASVYYLDLSKEIREKIKNLCFLQLTKLGVVK